MVVDNHSDDDCFKRFSTRIPTRKMHEFGTMVSNACNLGVHFSETTFCFNQILVNQAAIYNMWQFAKKNPLQALFAQKKFNGRYEKVRKFPNRLRLFGLTLVIHGVLCKTEDVSQDKKLSQIGCQDLSYH